MSHPEQGTSNGKALDRFPGKLFAGLADVYLRRIDYEGLGYLSQIEEKLKSGKSGLFVSDHPSTLTTTWTSNVVTMLHNRRNTGILLKDEHSPKEKQALGYVIRRIVAHHEVEPLFVKTVKHEPDEVIRRQYNQKAIDRGNEILESPGGVLMLFAQGTRGKSMQEAKLGLASFSALAGFVVPLTTITGIEHSRVIIHAPIPGKAGVNWCIEHFGAEDGPKIFSDLVMAITATGQPNMEKRGVYTEASKVLENYIKTGTFSNNGYEERTIRVLSAFTALKNNGFDRSLD